MYAYDICTKKGLKKEEYFYILRGGIDLLIAGTNLI